MAWNYGDLLDGCGAVLDPNAPALMHGDKIVSWGEFTARSNNLATSMLEMGAVPGDKVAIYLRNCPEYMETLGACFKARLVPVNVNYRYRDDELYYIFDNSDAVITVYGEEYRAGVRALKPRLPNLQWLEVGPAFEALASTGDGLPLEITRSGNDLVFIYTGGTTGMPKAVMWRQDDLWHALGSGATAPCNAGKAPESLREHLQSVANYGEGFRQLTACPLMHGTGLLTSLAMLSAGGCIVTLAGSGLDVEELWACVERRAIKGIIIVGDAFAKPMLAALDASPERWNVNSLARIVSSGVMWSPPVKQGLLKHNSNMLLLDAFGSSEALGFGTSITSANTAPKSAKFMVGESCKVFTEDFTEVVPGSQQRGVIARSGPIPLGYYKDRQKTAKTFPTVGGVRYSIPGDWCTVDSDGTLNLLGRGSGCINSGGEKIYPEEVEEALKTHPGVNDALVFGIEDEQWGQAVTAVVSLGSGHVLDQDALRGHVRALLADYKAPKRIVSSNISFRAPNGKADYKSARAYLENVQLIT